MLILPGHPLFDYTLFCAIPPDWRKTADQIGQNCCFVATAGSGLLRPATPNELEDYLNGGEYDEVMGEENELDISWD